MPEVKGWLYRLVGPGLARLLGATRESLAGAMQDGFLFARRDHPLVLQRPLMDNLRHARERV